VLPIIACIDGLKGFPEAIEIVYPNNEILHCIIHKVRDSIKYVSSKNQKAFMMRVQSHHIKRCRERSG
jgi:putative transposase